MIKNYIYGIGLVLLLGMPMANAQNDIKSKDEAIAKQGWTTEIDIGFDFLSNILINPSIGGGESRLGFGAALGVDAIYNKRKLNWNTELNIGYGIQKSGSGTIEVEGQPDQKVPFEKNLDNIWLHSKVALRTSYFSKFYYSADLFFSSQLTPTYEDNYITNVTQSDHPIAEFLSPAVLQAALGMEYRPNDYWSIFASPAAFKSIIVLNDDIANDFALNEEGDVLGSIHGNDFEVNPDGTVSYDNIDTQFGATLRVIYKNKLFKDRLGINTNVSLYSDYLGDVDHIDVNWRNEIDITIIKGLRLSLYGLLTYDHDVFVQISDQDSLGGVRRSALDQETPQLGRRVSYIQQLLLKYTYTF